MRKFTLEVLKPLIELLAITACISALTIALSILALYATRLYKVRGLAIITPIILALILEVIALPDHGDLRRWIAQDWIFYFGASPLLSSYFVSDFFRKRLEEQSYHSGT